MATAKERALMAEKWALQRKMALQNKQAALKAADYNLGQSQRGFDYSSVQNQRGLATGLEDLRRNLANNAADTGDYRGSYGQNANRQGTAGLYDTYNAGNYGLGENLAQAKYANQTALTGVNQDYENTLAGIALDERAYALANAGGGGRKTLPTTPTAPAQPGTYGQYKNAVWVATRGPGPHMYEAPEDLMAGAKAAYPKLQEDYKKAMGKYAVDLRKYMLG